jgi:phospholipid/cholesterol/gamma-HCH transport system ATP-binding protein
MPDPSEQPDYAIRVRNLVKRFDGRAVLEGINLDVKQGETVVVMGGSGCGKSTLLRHLIGTFKPDEGSIEILGQDVTNLNEAGMNEVRKKFGILFQSGALFNSMTLRQNVALPLEEHTQLDRNTIDIMVKIKLEMVGLREHGDKYPAQISGGMKKRAGLARALALDPQILFYDEPSAGLDPVTSAEIDMLMMNLSKQLGVTSVVVTHEMDSAFRIADRMAMLDKGKMLLVAPRQQFEELRDRKGDMDEKSALIRQFLRGDSEGPITQRKQSTNYADDLLGTPRGHGVPMPSVRASR